MATTAKKTRVIGRDAFAALKERRKKAEANAEPVALEIGGEQLTLRAFTPAAVLVDMMHYGNDGDVREALHALSRAFVPGDDDKLLDLLSADAETPVDMEYVTDIILIVAEELTGRPFENETA